MYSVDKLHKAYDIKTYLILGMDPDDIICMFIQLVRKNYRQYDPICAYNLTCLTRKKYAYYQSPIPIFRVCRGKVSDFLRLHDDHCIVSLQLVDYIPVKS